MADGLNDALKYVNVLPDRDEKRERYSNIESAGKNSAPGDGPGKSAAGILDFVPHDGGEFKADQAEADHSEGIEDEARIGGHSEVGGRDSGAKSQPYHHAQADEDSGGDKRPDGSEVVDPLADAETDNVENCQ